MKLNKRPVLLQDAPYQAPAISLFSLETEASLAESNIEPIDEDDNEYEWIG